MSIKFKSRIRRNGSTSFTVEVRVRGIQQTRTFQSKKESDRWAILTDLDTLLAILKDSDLPVQVEQQWPYLLLPFPF